MIAIFLLFFIYLLAQTFYYNNNTNNNKMMIEKKEKNLCTRFCLRCSRGQTIFSGYKYMLYEAAHQRIIGDRSIDGHGSSMIQNRRRCKGKESFKPNKG